MGNAQRTRLRLRASILVTSGQGRRKVVRAMSYAIKVIDEENDEEGFVCDGMSHHPTRYHSKREAKEFADFMRIGMEETILVVPYPERRREQAAGGSAAAKGEK